MHTQIKKTLFKYLLIPICLLFFAFILTILYYINSDTHINILSQNQIPTNFVQTPTSFRGEVTADENYLGILQMSIDEKVLIKEKSLFRIWKKGETDWYHTSTIDAAHFFYTPTYRFGFPFIADSKDKTYVFEVLLSEEARRNPNNTIFLSKKSRYVTLQYEYKKGLLLSDGHLLMAFIRAKLLFYMRSAGFWQVYTLYSIPFFIYLIYLFRLIRLAPADLRKRIQKNLARVSKPYLVTLAVLAVIDIFIVRPYSDWAMGIFALLWILGISSYKLQSKMSFYAALILIALCPCALIAGMNPVAEKAAIWIYVLLIIGVMHALLEIHADEEWRLTSALNRVGKVPIFIDHFIIEWGKKMGRFLHKGIRSITKTIYKKKPETFHEWLIAAYKTVVVLFILFAIGFFAFREAININSRIQAENHIKHRLSQNPQIDSLEPALVYKASKIVLYGRSFGWNEKKKDKLLVDGKAVATDLWTETMIVFTVPLPWTVGRHQLWIEKPIFWDGEIVIAKSKVVTFRILPITDSYTKEDAAYFKQLEKLRRKTLELNGYN